MLPVRPNRAGQLEFTWVTPMLGFIATFWFTWCLLAYSSVAKPIDSMRVAVRVVGMYCLLLGTVVFFVATTVKCWLKQFHNIVESLDTFQQFLVLKLFCKDGERPAGSRVADVTIWAVLSFYLCDFSCSVWENRNFDPTWTLTVNASDFSFVLMQVLYVRVVWSLSQSFKELNKVVKFCSYDRSDSKSRRTVTFIVTDIPSVTIEEIGKHHLRLVQTIGEINSFFGWQNLFVFARIILGTVVNPVYIVTSWTGVVAVDTSIMFYVLSQSQRFLFRIIQFILIASATSYANSQVKNVSLQMSNGKVEFTVLGLFTIDLSLIALMIGMSISYTIMVLQMDYSE
ncbi:hypothetical protein J6590_087414 [Homalodisca vitripennis]|nr:hypothetical protein J6590_087414 [Homalodisca vitripennis]